MAKLVLVDDHSLLRNGLAALVKSFGHEVLFEANNGNDFITKLVSTNLPDIVLLDINMPEMDGYETAQWIKTNHSTIKIMALSMYDNEGAIIRMLRCGAKGYILKDADPAELKAAIDAFVSKGYYYSDWVSNKIANVINKIDDDGVGFIRAIELNDREVEFLKYVCTDLTYKEISDKMFVSPRTVDGYRESLFKKLQLKTRVGLALYAIKNGIVNVE
ncbi:MAG: response regulator transcription factor [Ferruginibacter sp.]